MNDLILCDACDRHLRRAEPYCPFCGAGIRSEARTASPRIAPRGLSRAKLYAFHTAVATGLAANSCGSNPEPSSLPGVSEASPQDVATGAGDEKDDAGDATVSATEGSDAADAAALPDYGPVALPYGCVFPGSCDEVTV